MRVRLLTQRVGEFCNHLPGEIIDVKDDEARRMIDAGLAVSTPAMNQPVEAAMLAAPQARKRRG